MAQNQSTANGPEQEYITIPEDTQLIGVMMIEIRRAMRQASNFRNYKKGQIIIRFDNFGQYKGVKAGFED